LLVVREVPVGAGEMRKSSLVGSHVGEFGVCVPPVGCLNPSVDPTLLSGVAGQKADAGRPLVHLLNPRPTHPPSDFLLIKKKVRCWTLLGKGSPKTPKFCFTKKVHVESFPQKPTKISMSVFPRFYLKSCVWVFPAFITEVFVSERMRSTS
jgi:hypothetical protein